jgi:hypothetical protein
MKINSRRPRGFFEALAPTAQMFHGLMFHGLGKGLGRGRGPRLAEVPPVPKEQPVETREKIGVHSRTLVNVDGGLRPSPHRY